jgi:hypothetical protein
MFQPQPIVNTQPQLSPQVIHGINQSVPIPIHMSPFTLPQCVSPISVVNAVNNNWIWIAIIIFVLAFLYYRQHHLNKKKNNEHSETNQHTQ